MTPKITLFSVVSHCVWTLRLGETLRVGGSVLIMLVLRASVRKKLPQLSLIPQKTMDFTSCHFLCWATAGQRGSLK